MAITSHRCVLHRDEVHAEAPARPELGQTPRDGLRMHGQPRAVLRVRREGAPGIHLSAVAGEHLLVGRHHLDGPIGRHVDLGAGAGELLPGDELLDHTSALPQGRGGTTPARPRRAGAAGRRRRWRARARSRMPTTRFPSPAPLLSCLITTPRECGWARDISSMAAVMSPRLRTSSQPSGTGTPLSAEDPAPGALEAQRPQAGRGPVQGQPQAARDLDLGGGHVPGLDHGRAPRHDLGDAGEGPGALQQLLRDGPVADRSVHGDHVHPLPDAGLHLRAAPDRRSSRSVAGPGSSEHTKTSSHPGILASISISVRYRCSRASSRRP